MFVDCIDSAIACHPKILIGNKLYSFFFLKPTRLSISTTICSRRFKCKRTLHGVWHLLSTKVVENGSKLYCGMPVVVPQSFLLRLN